LEEILPVLNSGWSRRPFFREVINVRYEISGEFKTMEGWQKFKKIIEAKTEKYAIEKIFSLIGSNHKIKRHMIKIKEVRKVE